MALVRCLGPVEVTDGSGARVLHRFRATRTLLSLLAMHAGQTLTADWLMEHAWDGDPPESGLRALRFHISRLREGAGRQRCDRNPPWWLPAGAHAEKVDALAVEQLANGARLEPERRVAADRFSEVLAMMARHAVCRCCAVCIPTTTRLPASTSCTSPSPRTTSVPASTRAMAATWSPTSAVRRLSTRSASRCWAILITAQYSGRATGRQRCAATSRCVRCSPNRSASTRQASCRILQQRRGCSRIPVAPHTDGADVSPTTERPTVRRSNLPALSHTADRQRRSGRLAGHTRPATRPPPGHVLTGTGGVGKTRLAIELG